MSQRKLALILLVTLLVATFIAAGISYGEQKYNAFTGKWETTSKDGELRYNAHQGTWSYQQPGSRHEYSPANGTWDYAPPAQKPKSSYKKPSPKSSP